MTVHVIKMPDIGEGIAEVELVGWHVKVGDVVQEDQVLADVMTDKANVEIPSPVIGRVVSLGGEVGETMAVGSELIRIDVAIADEAKAKRAEVAMAQPAPLAPKAAAPAPTPARAAAASPASSRRPEAADRPIASPSVRRRAWELGVKLADVPPTGPAGRIMHADLDAWAAKHASGAAQASSAAQAAPAAPSMGTKREGEQKVSVVGLRRKIAMKMQESKRRIPHYSYVEEVDVTELEALRARLNAKFAGQRAKLTLLPFLMRAVVMTLPQFPDINARFDDEAGVLTRHAAVHLGIATQTSAGLLVPVVHHAEARDLWDMATEVARLAEAARSGRATRDELSGSTITITSLGPLGGIATTPVINHPEVAIVGVNRIVERPVIRQGLVVARQMMNLSSSFDHRVVDGYVAAEFVQAVRAALEAPALLFID